MSKLMGIGTNQALELQRKFGKNLLLEQEEISWFQIFIAQFKSPLIYILLIIGAISFVLQEFIDGSLALSVLIVNVLMGFYQEYNAQKTLVALRKLLKPKAVVIRDGKKNKIEARDIVPGDIVVLSAGDKIPADGHLIQGRKILVNEAILTGEEEALPKSTEENSRLLMGTIVVSGRGLMRVETIGRQTEMGKIGQSIEEIKDEETPLQKRLNKFSKNLGWFILGICFLIFVVGLWRHYEIWASFKMAVVLAIAAIPEALPIALTVILALGMREILKRKGLTRKLLSIETLGSTSVICTDKTGTLTEGKMQVVRLETTNLEKSLFVLTLDNEQKSNLEVALWDYVKKAGRFDPQKIYDQYEKIDEEPFDSEKKYSLSINKVEEKNMAFLMGAPEKVITFCQVSEEKKQEILKKIENWAGDGLRLLGLAEKETGDLKEKNNFHWLGLVGICDPVRDEVKEAINLVQQAGIKVKIITGDLRKTAEKVILSLGFQILPENVIDGQELEMMSDAELKKRIEKIILFSRVLPHQKLRIVQALQENGEVVAMTGDGVNDAPALKKANMGIAVGEATEVAKEASDLVLLDSNFKTIVAACEEGRLILANTKKVVGYVLSNSFAEIVLILGAMILNFTNPITVVQILWVHLICDGPPDILLVFEPKESDLMQRKPKEIQKEEIFSSNMKLLTLVISLTIGLMSLSLFWYFAKQGDINLARTITFVCIGAVDLIYIFAYKNLRSPIYKLENFFGNIYLFFGVAYGFGLLCIAIYLPFFNQLLKTVPLGWTHWLLILGVGAVTIFWVELVKFLENRSEIQ